MPIILIMFLMAVSLLNPALAYENCKQEGADLMVSEDYLALLDSRNDMTDEQLTIAIVVHSQIKADYDLCVMMDRVNNDSEVEK